MFRAGKTSSCIELVNVGVCHGRWDDKWCRCRFATMGSAMALAMLHRHLVALCIDKLRSSCVVCCHSSQAGA